MGGPGANRPEGARPEPRQTYWAAFMVGAGIMAGVDEIVFHQVLAWHHFYDRSTPAAALAADGFLHAAELTAIVAGAFLVVGLVRRGGLVPQWGWAGLLFGLGTFQVLDGVVNHKVLRLHQIRYGVHILPYDVAWITFGLVLVAVGIVVERRARAGTEGLAAGWGRA